MIRFLTRLPLLLVLTVMPICHRPPKSIVLNTSNSSAIDRAPPSALWLSVFIVVRRRRSLPRDDIVVPVLSNCRLLAADFRREGWALRLLNIRPGWRRKWTGD